jgi:hypothetical protein
VPAKRHSFAVLSSGYEKLIGDEIEEEYMSDWVGCCVSPGAGVTVKVIGGTKNLQEFARANGCEFTDHVDLKDELASLNINANLPQGTFATLSCRERNLMR